MKQLDFSNSIFPGYTLGNQTLNTVSHFPPGINSIVSFYEPVKFCEWTVMDQTCGGSL